MTDKELDKKNIEMFQFFAARTWKRKRERNGPGRVKIKLAKLLTEVLQERYPGIVVDPELLIDAKGSWRTDWRHDVYRWESLSIPIPGNNVLSVHLASWSTMTSLVKHGVVLSPDEALVHTYEVDPKTSEE